MQFKYHNNLQLFLLDIHKDGFVLKNGKKPRF